MKTDKDCDAPMQRQAFDVPLPRAKASLGNGERVSFWCPGCDRAHTVQTGTGGWGWNGSQTAPTFTPSVLVNYHMWEPPVTPENLDEFKKAPWEQQRVETICHSFVTDGRIQFLDDSTHSLAGQTVDLPDWEEHKNA